MGQNFPLEHFFKKRNTQSEIKPHSTPSHNTSSLFSSQNSEDLAEDSSSFQQDFFTQNNVKIEHTDQLFDPNELKLIENEILSGLKKFIPTQKYKAIIEGNLKLENINEKQCFFYVPTAFIKSMIQNHYCEGIKESVVEILGKSYEIQISVNKEALSSAPQNHNNILKSIYLKGQEEASTPSLEKKKSKSAKDVKFILGGHSTQQNELLDKVESQYIKHIHPQDNGILIDPKKTFNEFIIGPSNNMAWATANAVAENPGAKGKYPSLYLYSHSGLGKTHLLHAVANKIKEKFPHKVICLITTRDFMGEMISAIQENKIAEFRKKYSEKIDVLMIDDIHELKDKQGTQNEFFHIFNELHNKGKQLIFTSDKPPKEIDGIEERIKTRLQWGLVVDIQKPDLETRMAILKKKANELDLFLTDDVISLIAHSIKASIRELEGSLIKLSAYKDVMMVDIDIEMVKELLMLRPSSSEKQFTLEQIGKFCSLFFKIPLTDLKSKSRNKDIAKTRHIAMYLAQKLTKSTLNEIGSFFGGRDHTSVLHAINKIKQRAYAESHFSKTLKDIENNITQ